MLRGMNGSVRPDEAIGTVQVWNVSRLSAPSTLAPDHVTRRDLDLPLRSDLWSTLHAQFRFHFPDLENILGPLLMKSTVCSFHV